MKKAFFTISRHPSQYHTTHLPRVTFIGHASPLPSTSTSILHAVQRLNVVGLFSFDLDRQRTYPIFKDSPFLRSLQVGHITSFQHGLSLSIAVARHQLNPEYHGPQANYHRNIRWANCGMLPDQISGRDVWSRRGKYSGKNLILG